MKILIFCYGTDSKVAQIVKNPPAMQETWIPLWPPSAFHGLPWWLRQSRICLQYRRPRFDPWVRKIPWRREWQPSPVFLPGEFHGQRHLSSCSPWSCKELDTVKQLTLSLFCFSSALEIQVHELTLKVMNIEKC